MDVGLEFCLLIFRKTMSVFTDLTSRSVEERDLKSVNRISFLK